MEDTATPMWVFTALFGLWLGFRLSNSMHEGAADARAPNTARVLVTLFCLPMPLILVIVALSAQLPPLLSVALIVVASAATVMQLLQTWTEKPVPGKDCQGRDTVE